MVVFWPSMGWTERAAGQRRDKIHEAGIVALRAAGAFAYVGLDITPEEQREAIAESKFLLNRFEEMQKEVAPILKEILSAQELEALDTELKKRCGSGGGVESGRIEIQGDHRDRLVEELTRRGWKVRRAAG